MVESALLLLRQPGSPVHEPNRATAAVPDWAPSVVVVGLVVVGTGAVVAFVVLVELSLIHI